MIFHLKTISRHICFILLLVLTLYFTGCATFNYNYFQDGKPAGAGNTLMYGSINAGATKVYEVSETNEEDYDVIIKEEISFMPMATFNFQAGLHDNIDLYFGMGVGIVSFNIRAFPKFCLFDNTHKFGLGFIPVINFTSTPEKFIGLEFDQKVTNLGIHTNIALSYDFTDRFTVVTRPVYGWEWTRATIYSESGREFKSNFIPSNTFGLSLGLKFYTPKGKFIYPELTVMSFDSGKSYMPYFGIAFSFGNVKEN